MPTTRQGLSSAAIEKLIAQRVADAIATYKANQNNRTGTQNEPGGSAGENSHVKTVGIDAAYEMPWKEIIKMMTQLALLCLGMVTHGEKNIKRYILGLTYDIQGKVTSSKPTKLQEAIRMTHKLMDQVVRTKDAKDADN
ncbi:hypothetical protein Tco_0413572 [Tanacetum coccineum]